MSEEEKNTGQDPASKFVGEMDKVKDFDRDKDLNIYQRLHEVMKEVWYIKKEGNTGQFATVEHSDVTHKVRPSLVRHGIVVKVSEINESEPKFLEQQKSGRNGEYTEYFVLMKANIKVKFINIDKPDDFTVTPSFAVEKDKMPLSISGKILSYAIKYAIINTLNLETGIREDTDHLVEDDVDLNAVFIYNQLGEDLFGDKWEDMGKKKIYKITGGQTAEASRAPTRMLNEAIRNLYALKRKKEQEPDKDIEDINDEEDKNNGNDILRDFRE